MRVSMAMMSVAKRRQADDVDYKTQDTNDEKLIKPLQLMAFPKPLESIEDDLNANKSGTG